MKVIICGSRHLNPSIEEVDYAVKTSQFDVTEVVCGCCRGVDMAGKKWADLKGIPVKLFPPDWDAHGLAAGPIRNRKMAEYADVCIAIWDYKSKGTSGMLKIMDELGKDFCGWNYK